MKRDAGNLNEAAISHYREDGYCVIESVFDVNEVAAVNQEISAIESRMIAAAATGVEYHLDGKRFVDVGVHTLQFELPPNESRLRVLEPAHSLSPILLELISDRRILDPIRQILNTNRVSLWTDKVNFKCPGGTGFGWHQDAPYWMHTAEDLNCLPNVMITLDDVTVDNGAFRVIRGSHLAGNRTSKDDGSQLQGFYTHPDEIDLSESVEFVVPAGTAIIFDPFLIHGSSANVSSTPRRAMIATYQPADCLSLKAKTMINLC
jgi:ectoine hydroxylase-related dioxygenase (phytanoyl-CoA dioxygenase family)